MAARGRKLKMVPEFMSKAEASRYLGKGFSVRNVDNLLKKRKFPPGEPRGARGGRRVWSKSELDAFFMPGAREKERLAARIEYLSERVVRLEAAIALLEARARRFPKRTLMSRATK